MNKSDELKEMNLPSQEPGEPLQPRRADIQEVFDFIKEDLTKIEKILDANDEVTS